MLTEISEPATLHKFAFIRLYGENAKCFYSFALFLFAFVAGIRGEGCKAPKTITITKNKSTTKQNLEKFSSSPFQMVHR